MIQELKLTLGGKKRKFTFGILFIGSILDRLEVDYLEMFNVLGKNLVKHFPMLIYESLKNTYVSEGKDIDFTEKDIINWLNKEPLNGMNIIRQFEIAFMESLNNPVPNDEVKNDSVKKK